MFTTILTVIIPPEYHGREQSWLKHQFLTEYLRAWAHKLGSTARRLWYVDVFAGPWNSSAADLRDTSIRIGLDALEEAAKTWRDIEGKDIEVGAVFVEKKPSAFASLQAFLDQRDGIVETHPLCGEFGDHVEAIQRLIGIDPAFVFVDPTGFKGVEMQFIAPLVKPRYRDVLINVMFNHVNRWKDDPREFLREQMRAFFGLEDADLQPRLGEAELLRVYRHQLKTLCGLPWAADIAVPHPTIDRTWFRLVVGGRHSKVLEVFRDAERKVIGGQADLARTDASIRKDPNLWLFSSDQAVTGEDRRYTKQRVDDQERVLPMLRELIGDQELPWRQLWPKLMEELHLTLSDLSESCIAACRAGELSVRPNLAPRRRALHDDDMISVRSSPSDPLDGQGRA